MRSRRTWLLLAVVVIVGVIVGRWIGNSAVPADPEPREAATPRRLSRPDPGSAARDPKIGERQEFSMRFDEDAALAGALPGQRFVTFSDRESMERFLASLAGKGITVLGRLDALNTLRLGFLSADELAALLDGSEQMGFIFPAQIPGGGTIQDGAIGFGDQFRRWLGLNGDMSGFGDGVTVAVLDTGIVISDQFGNKVSLSNLVDLPSDLRDQNGHGTAVAALIAGQLGLAPDAKLLSYRIADDQGSSDTFLIAQAIVAATDAGANLINISLGSHGRSALLDQAIRYASDAGVLVIASAGNEGYNSVSYPAGYEDAISVGAVDANRSHLEFSNSGKVSITAPGLALTSSGTQNQPISFTGTSASAPMVTGSIALVMSQYRVDAPTAWQMLLASADEAGAPGTDPSYGGGVLNVGRTLNSKTPGITDVALASNYVTTDAQGNSTLQVTVENRGTAQIVNAPVTVTTPMGVSQLNVTTLAPGAIQTFKMPLALGTEEFQIDSFVGASGAGTDSNPSNNRRIDVVPAPDAP